MLWPVSRHSAARLHRGQPDGGLRGGETIVADERQLEAAAQTVAVQHGDGRKRSLVDGADGPVQRGDEGLRSPDGEIL